MRRIPLLLWAMAAGLIGLLIATQPTPIVIIVMIIGTLVLLASITPLAALAALLIFAPLRTLIATESRFQLPLDIGQLSLAVLLGAWIVYRIARRQPLLRFQWSSVYIPLFIFLVGIAPGAFFATSLGAWLNEWLKWIQITLLVAFCLNMAQREKWQWLVLGLVVAGLANAIIGIYEFFGGSGALHLLVNNRYFRAFGTFGQPNPFGAFMGLIAPIAISATLGYAWRVWTTWREQHRIVFSTIFVALFYALASVVLITALFMSWSRGAWLGFACSVAMIVLALPRKLWQGVTLIGLGGIFALILLVSGRLPATLVERFAAGEEYSIFDDMRGVEITPVNYAVVERLSHWQAALNMARENPFFGVGMGNYEVVYDQYRLMNWIFPLGHAHNYYLNIFAEAGIIGLAVYAALWTSVMWMSWQIRKHPDILARCVGIGVLGAWTYLTVHSLTDNLYVNNLFLHIGVMMGILAVLHRQIHHRIIIGFE
jgi:putative inorganic carbon (HCO3(-)) transporter